MIEIHSLTAIFATEAIVALLGALVLMLFLAARKKRGEREQAGELVTRLNETEKARLQQLDAALVESTELVDDEVRRQTLEAVGHQEKALYRHVIQAFLSRDAEKLAEIDNPVRALSEPYCQLVKQLIERMPAHDTSKAGEKLAALETEIRQARAEAERTNEQLTLALATLDEVSGEYVKMFGEPQQAEELHASRKRMLDAFRRTERLAAGGSIPDQHSDASAKRELP